MGAELKIIPDYKLAECSDFFNCHKDVTDSIEKRVNYGIGAERKKPGN